MFVHSNLSKNVFRDFIEILLCKLYQPIISWLFSNIEILTYLFLILALIYLFTF